MKIGKMKFNMDENYQKVDSMPEDPPNSIPYCFQTDMAMCFVMVMPIPAERAMPFGNEQPVIDGIHECLGDVQGLIKVDTGKTSSGKFFIYSIVKTVKSEGGVTYCLTLHLTDDKEVIQVQGFFEETGMTGTRDTMILSALMNEGHIKMGKNGPEGWMEDPYDPNFKRGICKNLSENEGADELFPTHPLSECRRVIKALIENN